MKIFLLILFLLVQKNIVNCNYYNHIYENHQRVYLFYEMIGEAEYLESPDGSAVRVYDPNYKYSQIIQKPDEIFLFSDTPYCRWNPEKRKHPSLEDIFYWREYNRSGYHIFFNTNFGNHKICSTKLTKEHIKVMKKIIEKNYLGRVLIDGIFVTFPLGEIINEEVQMFNHLKIDLFFHGNQITKISINPVYRGFNLEKALDKEVIFYLSVDWHKDFRNRLEAFQEDKTLIYHEFSFATKFFIYSLLLFFISFLFVYLWKKL
ncbi:transmembrane 9 superfamily member 1 [Anaeramoeba ignava]|uniref:Transmembrane 9 superfamily member n=1 Tax=Anaeramoeba ignava TaxID=1746090 RepID=A0A9Q0LF65_ANAIG|nr:transmembrane 9 superfamily member 1 [Anaeramoeba ignava]